MSEYKIEVSDWYPCIPKDTAKGCGACCIAPSITSPIPGMPEGKPAGVRCIQLNESNLCSIFNSAARPAVCEEFKSDAVICHSGPEEALKILSELENTTLQTL
ncbi:zinc/iron-chelating domain-containing protein [Vibrio parahaemolyticus]|uniref:YkgJ family cysteine cluster protein n=1 Tax=Vibrio parahaemolyticus TaxID=670 RepID=UPI0011243B25|nr:YkgJ family cysteine cluster protein [Vibrio parahaemolyticus]EKO3839029.1 YkgJ family cysteine cluster protein [Vibrio harveyi]TOB86118.1 zinc/iron-chelating domain-containing protein [Vibrio parahaemolyticus]